MLTTWTAASSAAALLLSACLAVFVLQDVWFGVGPIARTQLDCRIRISLAPQAPPSSSSFESGARARSVSPHELLLARSDLVSEGDAAGVPRIIHQSWKSQTLPKRFEAWSDSWRVRHPDWQHALWTDADNRQLVAQHYPAYLDVYDSLPREIYRADMVRNLYMHKFGGVYVDLDLEALRPIDPLVQVKRSTAIVARLGHDEQYDNSIPNAFLASTPGHPMWIEPVDFVRDNIHKLDVKHLPDHFRGAEKNGPELLTGPVPLRAAVNAFNESGHDVVILPPSTIYPFNYRDSTALGHCVCSAQSSTLDPAQCKARYPGAYAISYWSQSWGAANWATLKGVADFSAAPPMLACALMLMLALFGLVWASRRSATKSNDYTRLQSWIA